MCAFNLRRNLSDDETNDLTQLLSMLETISISPDREDERHWYPNSKGVFSVKSFYDELQGSHSYEAWGNWCWNELVLLRVLVFASWEG